MSETGVGRVQAVVFDCPDPERLARFYADLLGHEIASSDDEWVSTRGAGVQLAFQRVESYRAPEWPGQDVPQQLHLDIEVDDMRAAHERVLQLGATQADPSADPATDSFVVYFDPVGHPFCLVRE